MSELARRIDACLPQTQCTKCGYDGCLPYAEAISRGEAGIDRCPPGGDAGIAKLAALLDRAVLPLDPGCGELRPPQVAFIDERLCIGCLKCILACPVDAIAGASRLMHTVIADWCTGCELCIPPCPVDCISLQPAAGLPDPDLLRERHASRARRLVRDVAEHAARLEALDPWPSNEPAR